ncbi:LysM peptidoglycan-binding domain-containing protein [Knoellia locipacati]|uniref:LysM peptidoglycan-binding domain-containing protein n=1 Tax=Knoellia locipacati TaxID=882824 RepID=UPI00384C3599
MQTAPNGLKRHTASSPRRSLTRVARVAAVGATATVVVVGASWLLALAWLTAHAQVDAPGPASTDELLALTIATLAVGIAGWLGLGVVLEVLSHAPGRLGQTAGRWAHRLTPALARRVAAFVLGVGVGVAGGPSQAVAGSRAAHAVAVPADAPSDVRMPADPGFVPAGSSAGLGVPADPGFMPADPGFVPADPGSLWADPGFVPTGSGFGSADPSAGLGLPADPGFVPTGAEAGARTDAVPGATSAPTPAPSGTQVAPPHPGFTPRAPRVRPQADPGLLGTRGRSFTDHEVVVHRGDSLWSIAARHLGPDAVDAEIAHAWPQWYAANRDRIGDDPDLLLPGQVLRVPDSRQNEGAHR